MGRLFLAGALAILPLGVMAVARLSLRAQASWLRWFPKPLAHRWTLALGALASVVVFFTGPFLALGYPGVALAGAGVAILLIRFTAPDVLAWVREDWREHRAAGRGWFEHSAGCAAHKHHGCDGEGSQPARKPRPLPADRLAP